MKIFGYVNLEHGENDNFLKGIKTDEIIHRSGTRYDFSFAEKGDKIIIKEISSVAENLQEFVDFARVIEEIKVSVKIGKSIDTEKLDGKFLMGLFATISRYSEKLFSETV